LAMIALRIGGGCAIVVVDVTLAGHFFFQAEDGIRDFHVTGVQTCALPISSITATVSSSIVSVIGSVRHGTVTSNVSPIAYVLMFLSFHLTPLLGRYRWVGVGAAYPSRSVYRSPPWPVLVSRDPWRGPFLPG